MHLQCLMENVAEYFRLTGFKKPLDLTGGKDGINITEQIFGKEKKSEKKRRRAELYELSTLVRR